MSTDSTADAARARHAPAEEILTLVHDKNEVVLIALLENPALDESHIHILLQRLDISATVVAAVAQQTKWLKNESLRLALAVHPHTPPRVANQGLRIGIDHGPRAQRPTFGMLLTADWRGCRHRISPRPLRCAGAPVSPLSRPTDANR